MKNIAIFENNEELLDDLKRLIEKEEDAAICAASSNGNLAIELIKNTSPDIAIVDLVLCGIDGFGVLDYIKKNNPNCTCLALSSYVNDKTVNRAVELGAVYYMVKPIDPQTVLDRIKEFSDYKKDKKTEIVGGFEKADRKKVSLDEKISNIFTTIGIPPHIKGFTYLREGIKLVVDEPLLINSVTKELYPKIAKKFDTTPSKVERAIRHAIEVAWNRGRTDAISSVFGARVYIGNERPTNSEFIALVADKLILQSLE